MIKGGVYEIRLKDVSAVDSENHDRVYVGSSVRVERRIKQHFQMLLRGKHFNRPLQTAWNLYGADNFVVEVVFLSDKENVLHEVEQSCIRREQRIFNQVRAVACPKLSELKIKNLLKDSYRMRVIWKIEISTIKWVILIPHMLNRRFEYDERERKSMVALDRSERLAKILLEHY